MTLLDNPVQLIIMLFCLSLLPLFAVMGTSFLKLAIVFSMLRNALGIQQIPPNMAIYGLALILTLFTMAPVGMQINDNLKVTPIVFDSPNVIEQVNTQVIAPYRNFLQKNTSQTQIDFFANIGHKSWPDKYQDALSKDSLLVMVPAFTMSQLIEAFKIGLLIYLPFVAIDLIVSNILLAMGMMMVSPMTIALPFKLLIFILMGGMGKVNWPANGVILMSETIIVHFTSELLWMVLLLSLPVVVVASVVGVIVSLVQALTQIQDQTLQFLIKLVAVCVTLVVSYHWMGESLINYGNMAFDQISHMGG